MSEKAISDFILRFGQVIRKTRLFPGVRLHVDLVVNPRAGVFNHFFLRRKLAADLTRAFVPYADEAEREILFRPFLTRYPKHEEEVLAHLLEADPADDATDRRLVIVAGGDGTAKGVFTAFTKLPDPVRRKSALFRLPMGTGNDAADARSWPEALELLLLSGTPVEAPMVVFTDQGGAEQLAFNIASLGIDAFVADLTNRFKKILPGNSYSLMVDLATLFYERLVPQRPARIRAFFRGEASLSCDGPFLLLALGAGGHRTYGAGKRVLPDDRNLCLSAPMGLGRKLACRKPFFEGTHLGLPEVASAFFQDLSVDYPGRLPCQLDGEVFWIEAEQFPVRFVVKPSGIFVLRNAPALSSGSP